MKSLNHYRIFWILLFITLSLFFSCNPSKEEKFFFIPLTNNIGKISIELPQDFDTLLTWMRKSDYWCDDRYFRVQNSQYGIEMETQPFHDYTSKHYRQFTLRYFEQPKCVVEINRSINAKEALQNAREMAYISDTTIKFLITDSLIIDSHKFIVMGTQQKGWGKTESTIVRNLGGYTLINNYPINFEFMSNLDSDTNFLYNAMNYLKSIKISK